MKKTISIVCAILCTSFVVFSQTENKNKQQPKVTPKNLPTAKTVVDSNQKQPGLITVATPLQKKREDSLRKVIMQLGQSNANLRKDLEAAARIPDQLLTAAALSETRARQKDSLAKIVGTISSRNIELKKAVEAADSMNSENESTIESLSKVKDNFSDSVAAKERSLKEVIILGARPKVVEHLPRSIAFPQTVYSCEDTTCSQPVMDFLGTVTLLIDAKPGVNTLKGLTKLAGELERLDPKSTVDYYVGIRWYYSLFKDGMSENGTIMVQNVSDKLIYHMKVLERDPKIFSKYGITSAQAALLFKETIKNT